MLPLFLRLPRRPDFVIGPDNDPYLLRWWVIPRNRWFNIYLHKFMRSDDDRALHDHPWLFNASILIKGRYIEAMPRWMPLYDEYVAETPTVRRTRRAGAIYLRPSRAAHRVELIAGKPVWTIFVTGPVVRKWGFFCPSGWIPWTRFVQVREGGNEAGDGCGGG